MTDLRALLDVAVEAAHAGGAVTLDYFRSDRLGVEFKGDGSPVTLADKGSEKAIRAVFGAKTPHIDVLGEEEGLTGGDAELRWVVDPIDGTISFTRGIPLYGVLIGLRRADDDHGLAGVLHLPALGETYVAARGLGAWCGEARLTLAPEPPAGRTGPMISTGDPAWYADAGVMDDFARVAGISPYFRGYADCFGHALALRGAVDVHIDPGLSPWDLGPADVLFEEAGGAIHMRPSVQGGGIDAVMGRRNLVASVVTALGW